MGCILAALGIIAVKSVSLEAFSMPDKVESNDDADDENTDISSNTDEWQVLPSPGVFLEADFFQFFIWLALLRTDPPNFFLISNSFFPLPPDDSSGVAATSSGFLAATAGS